MNSCLILYLDFHRGDQDLESGTMMEANRRKCPHPASGDRPESGQHEWKYGVFQHRQSILKKYCRKLDPSMLTAS